MNRRTFWTSTLAVALVAPLFVLAQDQGGGRPGGPGGPGGFNPEEMRKRMIERMQEELGATPDDMQVITPKLEKVFTARRDAGGFGMGMMFGGGRGGRGGGRGPGGPGGPPNQPETPVSKAAGELRTTLENKDAPAEEINAKLTALREARAKARADLEAAQKDLVSVLSPRQEAVMVAMGMVD